MFSSFNIQVEPEESNTQTYFQKRRRNSNSSDSFLPPYDKSNKAANCKNCRTRICCRTNIYHFPKKIAIFASALQNPKIVFDDGREVSLTATSSLVNYFYKHFCQKCINKVQKCVVCGVLRFSEFKKCQVSYKKTRFICKTAKSRFPQLGKPITQRIGNFLSRNYNDSQPEEELEFSFITCYGKCLTGGWLQLLRRFMRRGVLEDLSPEDVQQGITTLKYIRDRNYSFMPRHGIEWLGKVIRQLEEGEY